MGCPKEGTGRGKGSNRGAGLWEIWSRKGGIKLQNSVEQMDGLHVIGKK